MPGSELGKLAVKIIADTKEFDKGIDDAKKGTDNFDKKLTSLSGTVKKLLGAGALIALAKKVADVGGRQLYWQQVKPKKYKQSLKPLLVALRMQQQQQPKN